MIQQVSVWPARFPASTFHSSAKPITSPLLYSSNYLNPYCYQGVNLQASTTFYSGLFLSFSPPQVCH
jgi:hypothetical protein